MATQEILLFEDIGAKGRKGDIVSVKSGFARNFLFPQGKAVRATKHAIRLQERLQEERKKQADLDKNESEKLAAQLTGKIYETEVKVDRDGHMYGSVAVLDVLRLINDEEGIEFDRRQISLAHPIKKLGTTEITLRLKEGVSSTIKVRVMGEGFVEPKDVPSTEEEVASEQEPEAETEA
jgi:large subunit ribosomal protein L9